MGGRHDKTTMLCSENQVSQNLASFFRTELLVPPVMMRRSSELSQMLPSRQTKHLTPEKWWHRSLLSSSGREQFLSHCNPCLLNDASSARRQKETGILQSKCRLVSPSGRQVLPHISTALYSCSLTLLRRSMGGKKICASCC